MQAAVTVLDLHKQPCEVASVHRHSEKLAACDARDCHLHYEPRLAGAGGTDDASVLAFGDLVVAENVVAGVKRHRQNFVEAPKCEVGANGRGIGHSKILQRIQNQSTKKC